MKNLTLKEVFNKFNTGDDTFDTYDNDDELYNIVSSVIDNAIWENEEIIGYSVTYAEFDNTYYFEII